MTAAWAFNAPTAHMARARSLIREFSLFLFCPDSIIFPFRRNNILVINQPPCRDFCFVSPIIKRTELLYFLLYKRNKVKALVFLVKNLVIFRFPLCYSQSRSSPFSSSCRQVFFCYSMADCVMLCTQFTSNFVLQLLKKRTTKNWNELVAVKKNKIAFVWQQPELQREKTMWQEVVRCFVIMAPIIHECRPERTSFSFQVFTFLLDSQMKRDLRTYSPRIRFEMGKLLELFFDFRFFDLLLLLLLSYFSVE